MVLSLHSSPEEVRVKAVSLATTAKLLIKRDHVLRLVFLTGWPLLLSVTLSCGRSLSFLPATNYAVARLPATVAVGDFNGDQKLDLAVACGDHVSILPGNGDGSFGPASTLAFFLPARDVVSSSVAVGDFNGDGNLDLAAAGRESPRAPFRNSISILLGTGTGSFGPPTIFAVGRSPSSIAVGDFNADGKLDLAVTNSNSGDLSILLGDGTGSFFAPATNFAVGTNPASVAIGDFNGDGRMDLAVVNATSKNVSILLGDGTGSFAPATNFDVGTNPNAVAIGDFNGDGKLDLAVADMGRSSVSILLGTGTGSFGQATSFTAGGPQSSVAAADFDGDGKLDLGLAATSWRLKRKEDKPVPVSLVTVLLGTGDGSFQPPINLAPGDRPWRVAAGDFNGDGKPDLAVANVDGQNVSIYLNASRWRLRLPSIGWIWL